MDWIDHSPYKDLTEIRRDGGFPNPVNFPHFWNPHFDTYRLEKLMEAFAAGTP